MHIVELGRLLNEFEMMLSSSVITCVRHLYGICLRKKIKVRINLGLYTRYSSRNFNQERADYSSGTSWIQQLWRLSIIK